MAGQTDMAYQYIKQKILEGEFRPAQNLTENQLSEVIGVSRNTIKKALLKLQQEKLVTIVDNKGASIRSFTLEEVINYLEIREVLEGLICRDIARDISHSELERLQITIEQMDINQQNNKFDDYSAGNKIFHNTIYKAAKNTQAVELINMISTQLIRYQFRTILVPGRNKVSFKEHLRIYEALKKHDEQEAEDAVRSHVSNVRQTIKENYYYLL